MKPLLLLLLASVAVNAAMVATLVNRPALAGPSFRSYFETSAARDKRVASERREQVLAAQREAKAEAAEKAKLWSTLATDDLKLLVQRLLAAGFPKHVVRGIVSDEINRRYNRQLAEATLAAEQPYWKPSAMGVNPQLSERRAQLARQRMLQLREVLGDDLLGAGVGTQSMLDRYTYNVPKEKRSLVQRIMQDYGEMIADVRAASQGMMLPEDREKLALLEREKRADLASVLTPEELENFDLRTSQITSRLSTSMTLMDATEDEFRTIFRLYQKYDSRLNPLGTGGGVFTMEMQQQRRQAESELHADVRAALGDTRAAEFIRSTDYEYQQLAQVAKRENLPADAAVRAFDLRSNAAEQSQKIGDDATLSPDQKRAALQALARDTRAKLLTTLGPNSGATYAKNASWLQAIESGAVVTFNGTMTSFRSIPSDHP